MCPDVGAGTKAGFRTQTLTSVKAARAPLRYNCAMPPPTATFPASARFAPRLAGAAQSDASVSASALQPARGWFLFAIGSLVLAGLLSLLLVVGRLPPMGFLLLVDGPGPRKRSVLRARTIRINEKSSRLQAATLLFAACARERFCQTCKGS